MGIHGLLSPHSSHVQHRNKKHSDNIEKQTLDNLQWTFTRRDNLHPEIIYTLDKIYSEPATWLFIRANTVICGLSGRLSEHLLEDLSSAL